jgi:hypothetical protein
MLAALLLAAFQQGVSPGPGGNAARPPERPAAIAAVSAAANDPLAPDLVFASPGSPRILRLGAPGSQLISVRVTVPVREAANEAGAGRLLQTMGVERVDDRARGNGISFAGSRTPWGITYSATGARADFDLIQELLHQALAEPTISEAEFERQRRTLYNEVLDRQETPTSRIVADLRTKAVPTAPPIDGTAASLFSMTRLAVRDVWTRTHRPDSMTVMVYGDVQQDRLLEAFKDLGAPRTATAGRSTSTLRPQTPRAVQGFRQWAGYGWVVSDARDPHVLVASVLITDALQGRTEPFESNVQLWDTERGRLLVVLGAAYPQGATRMRSRLSTLLRDTRTGLTESKVTEAVARVRRELLVGARTPMGLVSLVGRSYDATRDAGASTKLLAAPASRVAS